MAGTITNIRKTVRLLLVDELGEYCDQVRACVEMCQHEYKMECKVTSEMSEASDIMKDWDPTVVMVDLAISQSRSAELVQGCTDREVPVVALSDISSSELEKTVLSLGAVAYVPKDEDIDAVDQVVHLAASVAREPTHIH